MCRNRKESRSALASSHPIGQVHLVVGLGGGVEVPQRRTRRWKPKRGWRWTLATIPAVAKPCGGEHLAEAGGAHGLEGPRPVVAVRNDGRVRGAGAQVRSNTALWPAIWSSSARWGGRTRGAEVVGAQGVDAEHEHAAHVGAGADDQRRADERRSRRSGRGAGLGAQAGAAPPDPPMGKGRPVIWSNSSSRAMRRRATSCSCPPATTVTRARRRRSSPSTSGASAIAEPRIESGPRRAGAGSTRRWPERAGAARAGSRAPEGEGVGTNRAGSSRSSELEALQGRPGLRMDDGDVGRGFTRPHEHQLPVEEPPPPGFARRGAVRRRRVRHRRAADPPPRPGRGEALGLPPKGKGSGARYRSDCPLSATSSGMAKRSREPRRRPAGWRPAARGGPAAGPGAGPGRRADRWAPPREAGG